MPRVTDMDMLPLILIRVRSGPRSVVLPQDRLNPMEKRRFAFAKLICQGYGSKQGAPME
jgi:hypothetical protein